MTTNPAPSTASVETKDEMTSSAAHKSSSESSRSHAPHECTPTSTAKRPAACTTDASAPTSPDPRSKKQATASSPGKPTTEQHDVTVLDVARDLSLVDGTHIEVQWRVDEQLVWWPATLEAHDGRQQDGVAIRRLTYQPLEEHPEEEDPGTENVNTTEDVIFLSHDAILDCQTQETMQYRLAMDDPVLHVPHHAVENIVQQSIQQAFLRNQHRFQQLSADQQATIAEMIHTKKEKLVQLLLQQERTVTADAMTELLAQTMADE